MKKSNRIIKLKKEKNYQNLNPWKKRRQISEEKAKNLTI